MEVGGGVSERTRRSVVGPGGTRLSDVSHRDRVTVSTLSAHSTRSLASASRTWVYMPRLTDYPAECSSNRPIITCSLRVLAVSDQSPFLTMIASLCTSFRQACTRTLIDVHIN